MEEREIEGSPLDRWMESEGWSVIEDEVSKLNYSILNALTGECIDRAFSGEYSDSRSYAGKLYDIYRLLLQETSSRKAIMELLKPFSSYSAEIVEPRD